MRVLHAPFNIAGQAWEYAEGLREVGVDAEVWTFQPHPYGYPEHRSLNLAPTRRDPAALWKRFMAALQSRRFDVVHFHFGRTWLPRALDLNFLASRTRRVVVNFWGSDIRLRSIHASLSPHSGSYIELLHDEQGIRQMLRQMRRLAGAAVVPDVELRMYAETEFDRVETVPQAVDVQALMPSPPSERDRPVVVHSPSRRGFKGSEVVLRSVEALHARGVDFDFRLLEGQSNSQIRRAMAEADVVVDQLLIGTYGITAVESMALGKPVLTYISEFARAGYPADLGIVSAEPDTLKTKLEELLLNESRRRELGEQAREFAVRYHDRRQVARRLVELYQSL